MFWEALGGAQSSGGDWLTTQSAVPEREIALGTNVQQTKRALLALLTEEEAKSRKACKSDSRVDTWTFEDSARVIYSTKAREGWEAIGAALKAYQHAINLFWLHLHSEGYPARLYQSWRRQYRALAKDAPREDVEAEILFMLRDAARRFDPDRGVPFVHAAPQWIFGDLAEWIRLQVTDVRRPRAVRRGRVESDESFDRPTPALGQTMRDGDGPLAYPFDEDAQLELAAEERNAAKSHKAL